MLRKHRSPEIIDASKTSFRKYLLKRIPRFSLIASRRFCFCGNWSTFPYSFFNASFRDCNSASRSSIRAKSVWRFPSCPILVRFLEHRFVHSEIWKSTNQNPFWPLWRFLPHQEQTQNDPIRLISSQYFAFHWSIAYQNSSNQIAVYEMNNELLDF